MTDDNTIIDNAGRVWTVDWLQRVKSLNGIPATDISWGCTIDYKDDGRHEMIGADGKLYVWDETELKWKPRTSLSRG